MRTSSTIDALHGAPINCALEDDTWDITHTFLKADRAAGLKADITNLQPVHVAKVPTDPVDAGFKRAVADGDLAHSFRTWAHTFITRAMAVASGILAASGETEADWVKPAARFAKFQATSAAAGKQGGEESKDSDSKFDQLLAAMATQAAQTEQGMAQMRETQAQAQQAQTQLMQILGMIFAGQEQQRVTNGWVASSITTISASSGCAIEAAPEPQVAITMSPALVRFSKVAPDSDAMVTNTASDAVAAGSPALAASASGGGAAASPANSNKRNPKARTSASGGAASSTAAAIQIAAGSPPRKRGGLPPNHGAPPPPEEMDGLDDDDDDDAHRNGEAVDGEDGKVGSHGTATMLQCRYSELYGNSSPTKTQMMATEESERSSADAEADAKRVKEELLGSHHRLSFFYHGRAYLDPTG